MTNSRARGTARGLFNDYRAFAGWRFPVALLLMVGSAAAEGFGILMIVPLVAVAIGGANMPDELRFLASLVDGVDSELRLLVPVALFLVAMIFRALLLYARDILLTRLQIGYETSLQVRSAAMLATQGWPFASRIGQAGMQSLLLTDVGRAAVAVHYAQQAMVSLILLAVQFTLTAFLSLPMALIALALILLGYVFAWRWIRKAQRSGAALSGAYAESTAAGFRVHAGLKAALAQGTVPQFIAEYRASLSRLVDESVGLARDTARTRAGAGIASGIAASLLLVVGIHVLDLQFALLLPLLILFARMSGPALAFQQALQLAAAAAPAFTAVEQRIGEIPRRMDIPTRQPQPLDWAELRLENAAYHHRPGLGLTDATLTLGNKEWLGLGGGSGAGKTTLVDLIAGLVPPQAGTIAIDGAPLADRLEQWRDSIAYVGQGEMIFDDTVRGNLLADGAQASDDVLWESLEIVGLADRVSALESGLSERVGDRGSSLSGGERQRLALARALLRKPRLLILDEATSALDVEAERRLLERIRSTRPHCAALIIAHRSSTLELCDRRGTVRSGRYSEL